MKGSEWIPLKEIDYATAKFSRPHVRLHDGTILQYCFPNAGFWKGYTKDFKRKTVTDPDIEAVKYNKWHEWSMWQRENWEKLYGEKR